MIATAAWSSAAAAARPDDEMVGAERADHSAGDVLAKKQTWESQAGNPFEGERCAIGMRAPELPTSEAVETHRRTHVPYAAWCGECVAGGGHIIRIAGCIESLRQRQM